MTMWGMCVVCVGGGSGFVGATRRSWGASGGGGKDGPSPIQVYPMSKV